jgi:outer membrane protein W
MVIKKYSFILLVLPLFSFTQLFIPFCGFSQHQQDGSTNKEGILRVQGTISFGKLATLKENTLFLHGTLEYYAKNNIAIRGDVFHYLKSNNNSTLNLNHQLFAGASYHIPTHGNFDPYIGFQPGFSLTQYSTKSIQDVKSSRSINPLISGLIGFNYYATKWFHLFVDGRYVYGKHLSNLPPASINEYRISFGLGFNINTK